jgi:pimeloyl-ACP methyl ester carboxylesterase
LRFQEIFHITKRSVYAVDARNHGESPHTNVMSYSSMAKDVEAFAKQTKSSKVSYIGQF